jgi:hypothetical protein
MSLSANNGSPWRTTVRPGEPDSTSPGHALARLRLIYGLDAIKNLAEIALRDLNIVVVLQIEPKLRCVPSALASRSAVSAVMPACSPAIRSIRVRGKPQTLARAPADILNGTRNSSRRISPGCMGFSFLVIAAFSSRR